MWSSLYSWFIPAKDGYNFNDDCLQNDSIDDLKLLGDNDRIEVGSAMGDHVLLIGVTKALQNLDVLNHVQLGATGRTVSTF